MSFGIPVRNGLSVSLVSSTFLSSGRRLNPALNLDFLTGGPLDPRITFSRTSQATLVDSTGKLTYAPNNLLTNSEDFEAVSWPKSAATVSSNVTTAPNGTLTADKLAEDGTTAAHYLNRAGAVVNVPQIYSVYAKAAERTQIALQLGTNAAYFNLANGTVVSGGVGATITDAGNGWYRCAFLSTPSNANTQIYVAVNGGVTYAGTAGNGIYIWGAQLEQVTYQTTPGTYNSTSPKNLLGYTQEFDNAAWTKSNAFVQTNLIVQSQAFDTAAWIPDRCTVTANNIAAPDGTLTAELVTEDTTTNTRGVGYSNAYPNNAAGTYTVSIFVKAGSGRYCSLTFCDSTGSSYAVATFDLVGESVTKTGAAGSGWSHTSSSITNVGGGWYRVSTTGVAGTAFNRIYFALSNTATPTYSSYGRESYLGTGATYYIWGAQLVQGSTAGDYQRTDAAAAAVQYVAPDGSRTADLMVPTAVSGNHQVSQGVTTTASPFTYSVYAKAGGYDWLALAITDSGSTARIVYFNINTGVTGTGATGVTTSISAAGNGWYRCSATVSAALAGSNTCRIYATNTDGALAFTGNDTSGIYIWGAQLSNSASLDPYVYNPVAAPTSAAYYGPRFDYDPVTLANKGLLIEEQRTNLLRYSEQFDNAVWTNASPNMPTVTSNSIIAPDGTLTADTLTAATGGTSSQTRQNVGATGLTGNFTGSVYLKAGTSTRSRVIVVDSTTAFTIVGDFSITWSGGSATIQSVALGTASLINVGNGWYRCVITGNAPSANASVMLSIYPDTISGTGSVYAYGAQLEAGSFATSYIPTVASQVTRTADVALMQGANFSNWYNQNEGAIYAEFDQYSITSPNNQWAVFASDGTANNYLGSMTNPSSYRGLVVVGGSAQASIINGTVSANTLIKSMLAYKANDFAATSNGLAVGTDTSGSVPVVNSLTLGSGGGSAYLNGHIRRIGYYPTRLANAQLQSLTAQSTIPSLSLDFTTQVFNVG